MATHEELVRVFGEDEVVTIGRDDALANGVPPADAGFLASVGIPVSAGIFFSMRVEGELEPLSVFPVETPEGQVTLLVLGGSPDGDPVRFCLDLQRGYVILLGIEEEADAEIVNGSLDGFVEFLYRIELRDQELAGASDEEARAYTERMVALLRDRDPEAFEKDRLWGGLLAALADAGAPIPGTRKAVRRALQDAVPGSGPLVWGTGAEPFQGVQELSAHPAEGHWLVATHGFSDLDGDADGIGLGIELTMRVPRGDEEVPPGWVMETLVKLGEYVFGQERVFEDGHRMDIVNPLGGGGRLTALAFVEDPRLGKVETPGGTVTFLNVVGLTAEELEAAKSDGTHKAVEALTGPDGLVLNDITR